MSKAERCVRPHGSTTFFLFLCLVLWSPAWARAQHAGEIRIVAFNFAARNWVSCDGQQLSIKEYPQLFEVIGTTFGGDGKETFAVPDLRQKTAVHPRATGDGKVALGQTVGGSPGVKTNGPGVAATTTLALHFVIATRSKPYGFPIEENNVPPGEVRFYAGSRPPEGWMFCDGQRLQVEEYPLLFDEIGVTFGGDEKTWFAVPDMRGRTGFGVGPTPLRVTQPQEVLLGDKQADAATTLAGVGVHHIIRVGPAGKSWAEAAQNQEKFDLASAKYAVTAAKAKVASANRGLLHLQLQLIEKYPESADPDIDPTQLKVRLEEAVRAERELQSEKGIELEALRELHHRPRLLPPETTIGEIRILAGRSVPEGWLPCDGRTLPIHKHTSFYPMLGAIYGGDGRTVFSIPNLLHRVPIHAVDRQQQGVVGGELVRFALSDGPEEKRRTTWTTSMVPLRYYITPDGLFPTEN